MAKKRKKGSSSKKGIAAGVAAIIIIVVALVIVSVLNSGKTSTTDETENTELTDSTVVVLVNGEPITSAQLDAEYAKLPVQVTQVITKTAYLEELINQKLLEQEAMKLGLMVEDTEIEAVIDDVKLQNGLSEEEMETILNERGLSMADFREDVKTQLLVSKLYDEVIVSNVSEEDIQNLYDALEPVRVRHILLVADINETEESLQNRADSLLNIATEENFCDLVTNNTVDVASISNCGEYLVVKNSNFVPEFEQAAFDMAQGEFKIVTSEFGKHIMYKVGNVMIDDYRAELEAQLQAASDRDAIEEYLLSIRETADLVYPSDNQITGNVVDEELIPIDELTDYTEVIDEEIVVEMEEVTTEESMVEEVVIEQPIIEEVVIEEIVIEEPMDEEIVIEEVIEEEVMQNTEEPMDYTGVLTASRIACLESKDITLYGANWDSQTKLQLQLFPTTPSFYVECFETGSFRNKKAICSEVQAFPTWKINGQNIIGRLNIKHLESFTGC